MARRLFTVLAAVSSGLTVATFVAWVESGGVGLTDVLARRPDRSVLVRSAGDVLGVGVQEVAPAPAAGTTFDLTTPGWASYVRPGGHGRIVTGWGDAGPGLRASGRVGTTIASVRYALRFRRLALPYPLVILAAGTPASAWLLSAWWRRRRSAGRGVRGLCPACGYDLRASPGRCPECGAGAKGASK